MFSFFVYYSYSSYRCIFDSNSSLNRWRLVNYARLLFLGSLSLFSYCIILIFLNSRTLGKDMRIRFCFCFASLGFLGGLDKSNSEIRTFIYYLSILICLQLFIFGITLYSTSWITTFSKSALFSGCYSYAIFYIYLHILLKHLILNWHSSPSLEKPEQLKSSFIADT